MQRDILEDVSSLTTIPKSALLDLSNLEIRSMCDCVLETKLEKEQISELKLGIGTLVIKLEAGKVLYKFIPSCNFEIMLKTTLISDTSPVASSVEISLKNKIMNTYKDLL